MNPNLSPRQFDEQGPWVFHATSYNEDRDRMLTEGIRMANVPNTLARQRHEAGEDAEYSPGNGVGRGTYVGGKAYQVTGYGKNLIGISGMKPEEMAVPPESTVPTRTVERALQDHNGAMIVRDIPAERVHDFGRIHFEGHTDHWYVEEAARQRAAKAKS